MIQATYPLIFAALLFCVGVYGVLSRRNAVLVLMSVEMMLASVTINLVTVSYTHLTLPTNREV